MRVLASFPAILVYAGLGVGAAAGQVPVAPPPPQAPTVLPGTPAQAPTDLPVTPVSAPQILPGGPEAKAPAEAQTTDASNSSQDATDQSKDGKLPGDALGKRPLTPEEIREREIEKYNPLSRTNPLDAARPGGSEAAALDAAASGTPGGGAGGNSGKDPRLTPLAGSVAESNSRGADNPNGAGPEVVSQGGPSYNGPAVLSRDYTLARPMVSKEVKWSWNIGSAETWASGLVNGAATPGTASTSDSSFGASMSFSLTGRHYWREDQVGLNYGVGYNRYFGVNTYNGTNQHLSLDYGHQFSRRLSMNVVENGQITSANSTLQNPLTTPGMTIANINLAASPLSQLLDQTTRQFYTSVGLTWQQSARLSFNVSGGFFATQLTGAQLNGNVGYQAQADVNYRTSRKTTVGVYYSFSSYVYDKHIAVSNSNTVGVLYSYALNSSTQLRLRGGIASIETLAYTEVPIDPAFAALVGQSFGVVDAYNKRATSDISGQFIKDLRNSKTASLSYARGVAPGNGLILASIQESATASFSAKLFRQYGFSLTAGRTSLVSATANTGNYTSDFVGMTFSRPLPHGASSNLSLNYGKYSITSEPGLRSQISVSSGISWGPGAGRLW